MAGTKGRVAHWLAAHGLVLTFVVGAGSIPAATPMSDNTERSAVDATSTAAVGDGRFLVLVADPGWPFKDKLPGPGRGASKHYSTPALEVLVEAYRGWVTSSYVVADDAVLLCWRVASMQREALDLIDAWEFELKSEAVWLKRTLNGKRHFGMGRQVRLEHEVCLIATRGRVRARDMAVRSTFMECGACHGAGAGQELTAEGWVAADCPVCAGTGLAGDEEILRATAECSPSITFSAEAERVHSRKPACFRNIVERLYAGPYLELFAREHRPGWTCWGDEVPYACRDCGDQVTPDRKPPHYAMPVCHACLPPAEPLPVAG